MDHDRDVYVGLDYHTKSVQVCVVDADGRLLANRPVRDGVSGVINAAEQFGVVRRVAIESCGGAAEMAETLIQLKDWTVNLAHPGYVNRMKQNPDKSDYSDAHMLAELTRVGFLPRVWLAPRAIRELRALVRVRQQYVNQRRAIKLRIAAILREYHIRPGDDIGRSWSKHWRGWLEQVAVSDTIRWIIDEHMEQHDWVVQRITQTEQKLCAVTDGDEIIQRLQSLRGIGPVTAWVLRAEIGRFDRFRCGKQLARYCGLTPRNASSGERRADAGLIKAGNPLLRATLIEAAHRLARYDERWRTLAISMRARGKAGSLVAAAVANRWIRSLWSVMTATRGAAPMT